MTLVLNAANNYQLDGRPFAPLVFIETSINQFSSALRGASSGLLRALDILQYQPSAVSQKELEVWTAVRHGVKLAMASYLKVRPKFLSPFSNSSSSLILGYQSLEFGRKFTVGLNAIATAASNNSLGVQPLVAAVKKFAGTSAQFEAELAVYIGLVDGALAQLIALPQGGDQFRTKLAGLHAS